MTETPGNYRMDNGEPFPDQSRKEEIKTFLRSYIFTALTHSPSLKLADISQAMSEISEETEGKSGEEYLAQLKALRHFPGSMLK